jgi:hypothetical protein
MRLERHIEKIEAIIWAHCVADISVAIGVILVRVPMTIL